MREFSKSFMKRVTSTLLAALLVTGIVPTLAFAEDIHTDSESSEMPAITQNVYGQPNAGADHPGQPTNGLRMPFSLSTDGQDTQGASVEQSYIYIKGSAPAKKELVLTNGADQVKLTYSDQYYTSGDLYFEVTGLTQKDDELVMHYLSFRDINGEELTTSPGFKSTKEVKGFQTSGHQFFNYGSVTDAVYNYAGTVTLTKTKYDMFGQPQDIIYTSDGQYADFKVYQGQPQFYQKSYFAKDSLVTPYILKIYGNGIPTEKIDWDSPIELVDESNRVAAVDAREVKSGLEHRSSREHYSGLQHRVTDLSDRIPFYGNIFINTPDMQITRKEISGTVAFVNPPAEGQNYALQVNDKQGQPMAILPGILQATGSPIVTDIPYVTYGYPLAVPDADSFYIKLVGSRLSLDLLDIKLLDRDNAYIEVAHAVDSRYEAVDSQAKTAEMAVKMDVAAGTKLDAKHNYVLSVTPKDPAQPIYYSYSSKSVFYILNLTMLHGMDLVDQQPYLNFNVFAAVSSADEGKLAKFVLIQDGGTIGKVEAPLASHMNLQFKDSRGNLIRLEKESYYELDLYESKQPYGEYVSSRLYYYTYDQGFDKLPVGGGGGGPISEGGGTEGAPVPVVFPDTGDKNLQPLTAENLPLDFRILPTALDAGGEERLELIDYTKEKVVATLSGEKLAKGQPVDVTGDETHRYIPVTGQFPVPAGLHEGNYRLDWVGKSGRTNITEYFFYQTSKIYAAPPYSYVNQSKVTLNVSVLKTRELDSSALSAQVFDLLDREVEGVDVAIVNTYTDLDRNGYEITVTLPDARSQGHYQVRLSYDNEPIYSNLDPSAPIWNTNDKYLEISQQPIFKYFGTSIMTGEEPKINRDAYAYAYLSNVPDNAKLKALVYSGSLLKNTAVVHQLDLVKSSLIWPVVPYTFTQESLAGLDLTKRYSLVLYLNDQPIASLDNKLLEGGLLPEQVDVTGISLSSSAFSLTVGQEATLTATITPANATDQTVTWSSSNPAVATVDAEGKVHAVAAGSTTITAKAGDHTATAAITVNSSGSGSSSGGSYAPGPASSSNQTVMLGDLAITPKVDDKQNYAFAPSADEFAKLVGQNGQVAAELSLQFAGLPADAKGVDLAFKTEWLPAKTERLVISAPEIGTWAIGADTLKQLHTGKNVSLSLRKGSLKAELMIDGKAYTTENEQQPFRFSMPYEIKTGEQANTLVVVHVKDNGEKQILPRSSYDSAKKAMTFLSPATGYFEVVANPVALADVLTGAWYKPAIDYMAAHDTLSVKAGQSFMPKQDITRGEFVVMLMKTLGFSSDTQLTDNFSDAGNGDAAGYLAAAKQLGLVAGIGNNRFAPNERISRQDMFVILYQALEKISLLPAEGKGQNLAGFQDAASVAEYSRKALGYFVSAGVVSGNGKLILPKSNTTKAEAAQVLYNIFAKAN